MTQTDNEQYTPSPSDVYRKMSREEVQNLPLASFSGKIHFIRKHEDAKRAVHELSTEQLLGFDTDGPMTEQVMALMPTLIDVPAEASFNVNDLEQLKEVSRRLRSSSEQAE